MSPTEDSAQAPGVPPVPGSLSVQADHHSIAVGVAGQVNYHAPASPGITWPHQIGRMPAEAHGFQWRAAEAARAARSEDVPCVVLSGLGGVGKTQLAASLARTAVQTPPAQGGTELLVWITAGSRAAIIEGYAQAAQALLPVVPVDRERAATAFLAALEPKGGAPARRWMIVLDDLEDPADLRLLWPPVSPHGRTLVTTRRREYALSGSGREILKVGGFTDDEAVAYLRAALVGHPCPGSDAELAALAEELGHLPLALSQVVAYLVNSGLDAGSYRRRLADHHRRKLADLLPDPSALPGEQLEPATVVWSLSLDRADDLPPQGLARPMADLASVLDANGIPDAVLTSGPALDHLGAAAPACPVTAEQAADALRTLHRLNLVDHDHTTATVRMHQLVQRTLWDELTAEERDRVAGSAARALLAAWPPIDEDAALSQLLRANTAALDRWFGPSLWRTRNHGVLFRAATSLGRSGRAEAAAHRFRRLVALSERHLGPNDRDTLIARGRQADWRGEAGQLNAAVTGLKELLPDMERALGAYDPQVFTVRSSLAQWQGWAGNPSLAAYTLRRLLDHWRRLLPPDHPELLTVRANLAHWRGESGNTAAAEAELRAVLHDQTTTLPPGHPDLLATRDQLIRRQWQNGDREEALTSLGRLLPALQRALGDTAPRTLTARHDLANWRGESGDPAGAAAALEELLPVAAQALGADHPRVQRTRDCLEHWRSCIP